MRTRKEIEELWLGKPVQVAPEQMGYRPSGTFMEGLTLEVLLDIRDLLTLTNNTK